MKTNKSVKPANYVSKHNATVKHDYENDMNAILYEEREQLGFEDMMYKTGYETNTSFYGLFSFAEYKYTLQEAIDAINKQFNTTFKQVKGYAKYVTELVMVLNYKIWELYKGSDRLPINTKDVIELSKLYHKLYTEANDWCLNNLKGDDFSYYYHTLD